LTTYQIVIKEKEDLHTNREFRRKRGHPL